MTNSSKIFCAIDTYDLETAIQWAKEIGPVTGALKLGLEFFNAHGPQGVEKVLQGAGTIDLFLDLKFHDIPNTVAGAVRAVCSRFSPAYVNVHASGGFSMLQAAKESCDLASNGKTKLLGVTLLTSLTPAEVSEIGYKDDGVKPRALDLVRLSQKAGLDGVVCSAHEIETIRTEFPGGDFDLVVPGIRPHGSSQDDQRRVMQPHEALKLGATHLVVGRPITQSKNPAQAAQDILDSLV